MISVQGIRGSVVSRKPTESQPAEITQPLFRSASKAWNSWWQLRPAPVSPKGRWAYKPTVRKVDPDDLEGALGVTSEWGDIEISSALSKEDARATLFHEEVHSFLSPKLYILRNFRAQVASQGYVKSVLRRYLEEAIAETRAALKTKGLDLNALLKGIRFPITSGGYEITISRMRTEAAGILLGPINVGGMVWNVWQSGREG